MKSIYNVRKSVIITAGLISSLQVAAPALAAETIEEVVVTARKKQESSLDVPVAVAAISGEKIESQGLTDLNRIAQMTPQVILAQGDSGAGASFVIRGLGSSAFDAGIEQSVVVNIDGVPATRGALVTTSMFDLQQIEVLKGPQVLFFGKNSPAGVISISSRGPSDEFEAQIRTGYEFEAAERYVEGVVSGPISSTLGARLAVRASQMDGWMENVAQAFTDFGGNNPNPFNPLGTSVDDDDRPGGEDYQARITLSWEPSERFDASLKYAISSKEYNGGFTQAWCEGGSNSAPVDTLGPAALPDPYGDCKYDNKLTSVGVVPEIARDWANAGDGSPIFEQDTQFTTLTMNYSLDNMTLTSVTGHMSLENLIRENLDRTSYGLAFSTPGEDTGSFSQEFRLITDLNGALNFSAGLFYEQVDRLSFTDSFLFFGGPDPVTGKYHTFELEHQADSKTYSAFFQLRYQITDKLELAAGARYTDEERTQESRNVFTHTFTAPILALVPASTTPLNGRFTDTDISPEATLSYKPSDNSMVYAAYKTGYKSGGFSSPSLYQIDPSTGAPVTANQLSFDPEKAEGFEVGYKSRLLENTLRLEAVAYYYTYDDLQTSVFEPEAFSFFIKNAASAVVKGVEVTSEWVASENLSLFTDIAFNRAEYDEFTNGQCYTGQTDCIDGKNDLSGEPLTRAPEWNYNLGFSYDLALGNSHTLIVGGDINFTDDYLTQEDQNPFARQKAFTTMNSNLRLESNDGKYEIAVIGRNLGNERYIELTTSKAFGSTAGFGDFTPSTIRGREIRIEGIYHF